MAFVFKLQKLLELAEHEEEQVKLELAAKDAEIKALEKKDREAEQKYNATIDSRYEHLKNGDIIQLNMCTAYLDIITKIRLQYKEDLADLQAQRQEIVQRLTEKRKTTKTYEKIKENEEDKYKKHMLKIEQKQLDEFGSRLRTSDPEGEYNA
ncbi:MAG: flagellar export protein FliJ [Candidatus Riflebacteria bacterium]|nr:flagellar export protein FliJ [Candidatus Riflebacteria bacterium]